jgi:integrase
MSKRLTALAVENAKAGPSRREISDGGHNGLHLVVQPSGHKSWAVRFRVHGVPRKLTLDAGLSLADARVQAAAVVKDAHIGNDPTKAKKVAKQQAEVAKANTFAGVATLLLDSHKVQRLRTKDQVRDLLQRLALPHLGDMPIGEIRRSHIVAALDHVERHNGPRAADSALYVIRRVLEFHCLRDDDYVVPIAKGMNRSSAADRVRKHTLTDDEVRKLWDTGDRFVKFLLLSSCRRGEAAAMRWKELDGNDWTLPAARNKVKQDLVRPLSEAALKVLGKRGGDDDFVFSITPGKPLSAFSRHKRRIDKASGVRGWRWHDLRRTSRTLMSRAGVYPDHAERVLGHVIGGIRGNYDRYEFHKEKAHALEALASLIGLITNPPAKGSNVRQLKRRA